MTFHIFSTVACGCVMVIMYVKSWSFQSGICLARGITGIRDNQIYFRCRTIDPSTVDAMFSFSWTEEPEGGTMVLCEHHLKYLWVYPILYIVEAINCTSDM